MKNNLNASSINSPSPINYEDLFRSAPDLYLLLDRDFNILDASDAYIEAVKLTRNDLINRNVFDVFPENPDDNTRPKPSALQNFRQSLMRVLDTQQKDVMDIQRYDLNRNGKFEIHYWSPVNYPIFDQNRQVINILLRLDDVTEFVQTEYTQSRLAAIVQFTDDAIIAKDLSGIIQTWNKGAEKLYGYTEAEVVGHSIEKIFPENHKKEFMDIIEEIKQHKPVIFMETERKHKDGHIIPVSVSISPIKNKEGRVIGACSIAKDISEWKKIQKMKDEFISTVSHELRTPLTSIQGSLSLLVGGAAGHFEHKAQNLLKIAEQNSSRLIRLINDILDISKIESGRMNFFIKPYSLDALLHESIASNKAYADRFATQIVLENSSKSTINVDKDRFLQVMANLLSNAIKFSDKTHSVNVAVEEKNNQVRICVSNKGPGIPEDFRNKMFQKFTQLDASTARMYGGTGLGLSITKQIIEKFGGTINYISKPNQFTTFYFDLPRQSIQKFDKKAFKKIPLILVCEPDKFVADSLKQMLEKNECKVLLTSSASEANEKICDQLIDALIIDMELPDQDGIAFIKDIHCNRKFAPLPIVVISVEKNVKKRQLSGNAFTIVDWLEKKPFDKDRVLDIIQLIKTQIQIYTPSILHIEDDSDLIQIVGSMLEHQANVVTVPTLKEAHNELKNGHYDLIILDLMLPDGSGTELIPLISNKHIPIIVYSAYELPEKYSEFVLTKLTKSQTSQKDFLEAVKSSLLVGKIIENP